MTFIPGDQWIKLSQEQKDNLISDRQKERRTSSNGKPRTAYPPRQASAHDVDEVVDIDVIIDYTMLNHDANADDDDDKGNTTDSDSLLSYMAGRSSLAGDICKVIKTKTKSPNKVNSAAGTSCKVNASKSTPSAIQVDDNTYYLYEGDSIKDDGHQYFAHSTIINYWIGQWSSILSTFDYHQLLDRPT
jgi:hypothetical protein